MVTNVLDVHLANGDTFSAVDTFGALHLHAQERDLVKQTVKRAQRTEESAENAVDKDRADDAADHQKEFPRKERPQHAEAAFVDLVGKQTDRALKRSRGAKILAKSREREITEHVKERNDKDEHDQHDVFEVGQNACQSSLFDLGRGDLVQKILNQAKGAKEAADPAAKQKAKQKNDAKDVIRNGAVAACHRVLQSAQGARAGRARAGIAVQSRSADVFDGSLVDLPVSKALEVRVEQQS